MLLALAVAEFQAAVVAVRVDIKQPQGLLLLAQHLIRLLLVVAVLGVLAATAQAVAIQFLALLLQQAAAMAAVAVMLVLLAGLPVVLETLMQQQLHHHQQDKAMQALVVVVQ